MKTLTLLLLLALIWNVDAQAVSCDSQACCEAYQTPNKFSGSGYLEFSEDCMNGGNGTHCTSDVEGCSLCSNPLEAFNDSSNTLPTCSRFEGDLDKEEGTGLDGDCETDACCAHLQSANPSTGGGYLQFDPDCAGIGGSNCVGFTGCILCSNPFIVNSNNNDNTNNDSSNQNQKRHAVNPLVCFRFGGPAVDNNPNDETTGTSGGGSPANGTSGTEGSPANGTSGTGGETTEVRICIDEGCCEALQNPNPFTGQGYLEFWDDCTDGAGLHCVGDFVGCRLCRNPFESANDSAGTFRPICQRFEGEGQVGEETCHTESCCEDRQNPNPSTGSGYLEFAEDCLDGGLFCVGNSGCRLCVNPFATGYTERPNIPGACQRFAQGGTTGVSTTGATTGVVTTETTQQTTETSGGTSGGECDAFIDMSPILAFPNEGDEFGVSTLIRAPDILSSYENYMNISGEFVGDAYTLWVVWFTNPSNCFSSPCTGEDIGNSDAGSGWAYGGGGIIPDTSFLGRASFYIAQPEGFQGEDIGDTTSAQVHIFLRSHGDPFTNTTQFWEQISSVDGPCNPNCRTIYFSVHQ